MTERNTADGLDFEALRESIERCNLDLMLGFYAEEAELRIVNAGNPQSLPFELRGKAEIAKHLRATFGQETSHRVEREVVDKNHVTFREMCEYPDGSWVRVETTLEVHDGKIVRQADVVAKDVQSDPGKEVSRGPPPQTPQPWPHPGVDAPQPDRLLRSKQATEKEDLR
jgi:hypothetical protein